MSWNTKRWVKVPVYESPQFLMLPLQTRGLYRLITPYLGPTGRLQLGPDLALGLAVVLRCEKSEIESRLEELITSQFLLVENGDTIFDPFFIQSPQTVRPDSSKLTSLDIEVEVDKRKKKPGRPPADPRHKPVIDLFHDLWAEVRGGKYVVQGRDVRAVSDLLKKTPGIEVPEFERRIRAAMHSDWFRKGNGSLHFFCLNWSNYENVSVLGRMKPAAKTVVSINHETGVVTYSDGTTGKAQSGGSR